MAQNDDMRLSFLFPAALWLLLVLVPLWGLAFATPRRRAPAGAWASLTIRSILIAALIFALAGARLVHDTSDLTTVFLLDRSDSITPAARARADAFVRASLPAMGPGDRAAVVAFGANAVVERMPNEQTDVGELSALPSAAGTNIQEAVQLGLALLPAETNKRLVLLSDGGENSGDARTAAQLAAARGVPLSYVDLSSRVGAAEALVADLHAPSPVRVGQSFELVAVIESTVAQTAHLRILGDGKPVAERDVQLEAGLNRLPVKVDARAVGFQHYRAELVPQRDVRAENNVGEALVQIVGTAKVLLVEGAPGEGRNFKDALAAAKVTADTVAPAAVPVDPNRLNAYDAVVLINVPAAALSQPVMERLRSYVHDFGRGLVMIGGDHAYGVGGYHKTPIEDALPVYVDAPDRQERPTVALVFVLDKSSSMSGCHCRGPDRKNDGYYDDHHPFNLDIAKEGVKQSVAVLNKQDIVGVVMFDTGASQVFPLQRAPSADDVMCAIAGVKPRGDTNIVAGLAQAQQMLAKTNARIKHIVLFTDGIDRENDSIAQAQQLPQQGITLSVVGEGLGAVQFLQQLAQAGHGRYIQVVNTGEVPQIFVQETRNVSSKFMVERAFTPRYGTPSPILSGLEHGLPALYGYDGTTPKQTATIALADADGSPVLAQWQYGLGRAVAWTSDAKGKWAKDWVAWAQYPRFAAQLVGWVLPTGQGDRLNVDMHAEGAQIRVDVTALKRPDLTRQALDMRATIVGADGTRREVPLESQAPGVYRGMIAAPPQGTYMIQAAEIQGGHVVARQNVPLVVPYSPEYRLGQSSPALLAALARLTGGQRLATPSEAFARVAQGVGSAQDMSRALLALALILLPIDIAIRRLVVLWRTRSPARPMRLR